MDNEKHREVEMNNGNTAESLYRLSKMVPYSNFKKITYESHFDNAYQSIDMQLFGSLSSIQIFEYSNNELQITACTNIDVGRSSRLQSDDPYEYYVKQEIFYSFNLDTLELNEFTKVDTDSSFEDEIPSELFKESDEINESVKYLMMLSEVKATVFSALLQGYDLIAFYKDLTNKEQATLYNRSGSCFYHAKVTPEYSIYDFSQLYQKVRTGYQNYLMEEKRNNYLPINKDIQF